MSVAKSHRAVAPHRAAEQSKHGAMKRDKTGHFYRAVRAGLYKSGARRDDNARCNTTEQQQTHPVDNYPPVRRLTPMTTTPQIYELKHIPAGTYTDQNGHTSNIYDSVYVQTMPTGTVCVTVQRQTPDLGIFNEDFDLMLTPAMAEELGTQIIVAARRNPYAITRQETP